MLISLVNQNQRNRKKVNKNLNKTKTLEDLEDLEDAHVLHEGQAGIQMSCNHVLRQFWPVIKFSSYD